jgi:hypothetical protein
MTALAWTATPPTEPGFWWCCQNRSVRMVKVWRYSDPKDARLFTNEDGGSLVTDREIYTGCVWAGPIQPPEAP